ncbi:DUF11 domain-containing protein [Streptomyces sp. NBC_01278]|uniref:hypothetical protein n=1 Tax=Streptomyces sp. NBC_01278 TaxID=2903809 RepID=UPI002E2FE7C7|nr:hypothetical protein [Streptomyces sp. NBC_01278]
MTPYDPATGQWTVGDLADGATATLVLRAPAPAAEEGIDPGPVGEIREHRPPGNPAGDQVDDGVGSKGLNRRPFHVRHARRIRAPPAGVIGV